MSDWLFLAQLCTNPISKMVATAAIFKIFLLLHKNYRVDFNHISHTGSLWCLVVSNWISNRSDISKMAATTVILKISLSVFPRNFCIFFKSQTCSWCCLVVSNWISDRSDIQDDRHDIMLRMLLRKLLDVFRDRSTLNITAAAGILKIWLL